MLGWSPAPGALKATCAAQLSHEPNLSGPDTIRLSSDGKRKVINVATIKHTTFARWGAGRERSNDGNMTFVHGAGGGGGEKEAMVGNEARSDLGVSVFAVETSLGRASGGGVCVLCPEY